MLAHIEHVQFSYGPISSNALWLVWTISSTPSSLQYSSRNWIISGNLNVVSTCISGKGSLPGAKAFTARCSSTDESFPTE